MQSLKFLVPPFFRCRFQKVASSFPLVTMKDGPSVIPNSEGEKLDRELFNNTLSIYALRTPPKLCHSLRNVLKAHLLTMPRVNVVVKPLSQNSPSSLPYILILSRYLADDMPEGARCAQGNLDDSDVGDASKVIKKILSECTPSKIAAVEEKKVERAKKRRKKEQNEMSLKKDENNDGVTLESFINSLTEDSLTKWPLQLTYTNCSIDHVLRHVLPNNVTVPSSFESIGHIAHINLRDEHEPWKEVIGTVMLDKLAPRIRTVVNKTESTGGPYRTFAMEILAGEKNLVTSVRENNCTFHLDFENVYWNSRLETEHRRIVDLIRDGEVFIDAFCGVGPFVVPSAKRGRCKKIYANDLNPSSVKYLKENIKKNGIQQDKISTCCGCARDFIRNLVQKEHVNISRIVMNFPSGAPEFLDVFRGLYNDWKGDDTPNMPIVHCYCFIKGELETDAARRRVRMALFGNTEGGKSILVDSDIDVRVVRDVAPKKVQVCVTFKLPHAVAIDKSLQAKSNLLKQNNNWSCSVM